MADPINYCSWLASSFCITQSEWATWSQAGLTVGTFAFAMWRQSVTDARSEEKVAIAEDKLRKERLQNSKTRALATAISIRVDIDSFNSVVSALPSHGLDVNPSEVFAGSEPSLGLRLRAMEALDLMDATSAVLAAVHAAQSVHNYLDACRNDETFGERERKHLSEVCPIYLKQGEEASEQIATLIQTGLRRGKSQ
ncbi:hypothetical protein [Stenotrophomonas sp.]|uniref:hypothetical protein n=1 Tax=Stenotrophomonas sp. TaxID=69392 RepID=UPI0028AB795A|nr:hypothetical protein [Stenotrophomonas sp.]